MLLTARASAYRSPTLTLDRGRRIEPPSTWEEIDLREVIGKTCAELGGRMVMRWRGFWIIRGGRPPLKVVYVNGRKERKF